MLLKRHGAAATMNDTEKAERDMLGALHSPDGTRRWKALEEDEASEKSERRGEERRRDRNLNPEVIILIGPN